MYIFFLGPPGAGKGTQCKILSDKYKKINVITASSALKVKLNNSALLSTGELLPDDVVVHALYDTMKGDNFYLIDGAPRSLAQAKLMHEYNIIPSLVLELFAPWEYTLERILGRMIHEPSGRLYHDKYNPPKVSGYDDITCEPLIRRKDDDSNIFKRRCDIYCQHREDIKAFYHEKNISYYIIDASQNINTITTVIEECLISHQLLP